MLNPAFNGMMTEEINHSYDGGLYGELVQNRVFKDDPTTPVHWSLIQTNGGVGSIALDTTQPVPNTALTASLKVTVSQGQRVGVANDGYWGIPIRPFTTYRASFWAKAAPGFTGPLFLDIESNDGRVVYARAQVPQITANWAKYSSTDPDFCHFAHGEHPLRCFDGNSRRFLVNSSITFPADR